MFYLKTDEDIEYLRQANLIVAKTLAHVGHFVKPGITTLELDHIAESFILSCGAKPNFLGVPGSKKPYPNTICTSVNDQVMHAIPSNYILQEGDIISVDCGAVKNGFHGDSCYTFAVGHISDKAAALLNITKAALYCGIDKAVEGNRLEDISAAIQQCVENAGFSVCRVGSGHGIGRDMHEDPLVRNYGKEGRGIKLRRGMVFCIEPMVMCGDSDVDFSKDGWTISTSDHSLAAHFEHAISVGRQKADILSSFKFIEDNI